MIDLFLRFGVAIHIALMVVYASWARGGSSPVYLWALPWLALGVAEMTLLLPPASRGEAPQTALRRLIRGVLLDPVFYIGLALVGYLTVQWVNGPCELVESASALAGWEYEAPPYPGLPFCTDQGGAVQVLIWFLAVSVAVVAVRQALKPSARIFLLKLFVANGALLSLLGFAQIISCPGKLFWYRPMVVYYFATFGYPNHAGTFFVMMTALNLGLLIRALGNPDHRRDAGWLSVALFLNAAAIYGSLSRAAIILGSLILLAGLVYALFYLGRRVSRIHVLVTMALIGCIAVGVAVFAFVPGSPLKKELDSIDLAHLGSVYEGDRQELSRAAIQIWEDHRWTGVGGWGFPRYVGLYMDEDRWDYLRQSGRANVHNDALQFLCEHGMIGFGLMLAMTAALLVHAIAALFGVRRVPDPRTGRPLSWFQSVSPCVWGVFAAVVAMAVHSTIDLPFRSIANTLVWFVCLACVPGFLPKDKK